MEGKYPETHLKAHDLILSFYDTGTFLFLENCIVINISLEIKIKILYKVFDTCLHFF